MGSFDYIAKLRAGLLADDITWDVVLDRIHGSAPWQKADWKKRRAVLIEASCGHCGSTQGPMVLQHTWHPDLFSETCEQIKRELLATTDLLKRFPYPSDPPAFDPLTAPAQPSTPRNGCPRCGSVNVKQRKDGSWACHYHSHGRRCGRVFEQPVLIQYQKFDSEARWLSHLESQHRWESAKPFHAWNEQIMGECRPVILKQAALIALDQHERYVGLRAEDVVTRCKRCAFREDRGFLFSYQTGLMQERVRKARGGSSSGV